MLCLLEFRIHIYYLLLSFINNRWGSGPAVQSSAANGYRYVLLLDSARRDYGMSVSFGMVARDLHSDKQFCAFCLGKRLHLCDCICKRVCVCVCCVWSLQCIIFWVLTEKININVSEKKLKGGVECGSCYFQVCFLVGTLLDGGGGVPQFLGVIYFR